MSAKKPSTFLLEQVHSANLANIMRKVQEKKSLTAIEVKQLNEAKRASGIGSMEKVQKILDDGILVMRAIRGIIENSKLAAKDKREILGKIAAISEQCTVD